MCVHLPAAMQMFKMFITKGYENLSRNHCCRLDRIYILTQTNVEVIRKLNNPTLFLVYLPHLFIIYDLGLLYPNILCHIIFIRHYEKWTPFLLQWLDLPSYQTPYTFFFILSTSNTTQKLLYLKNRLTFALTWREFFFAHI